MLLNGNSGREHIGWGEEQRGARRRRCQYLLVVFGRKERKREKETNRRAQLKRADGNLYRMPSDT